MADTVSKTERSRIMAAVKGKDTAPEMVVRRMVHAMGYRYRLHVRGLPGTPDMVLVRHGKIIEVRGCFWHDHATGKCLGRGCRLPVANRAYWRGKIARNRRRDAATLVALRRLGWRVLIVWECQTSGAVPLAARLRGFLQRGVAVAKRN
ncbi:MAG: very short patch repair endonuclease [Phycisphaeraceae bacterium]